VGGIVALVLAVAFGGWFAWRWRERGPNEASVGEAVSRFRTSSTVDEGVAPLRPPAGVYTYSGSGTEHLSFLATSQGQGPKIPGTVTHRGSNCWTFEVEYNSFHRQTWDWCTRDGRLIERGGTTNQKFDFVAFKVDETSRFTCDPPIVVIDPDAETGTKWKARCTGHSVTSDADVTTAGTLRFVGRETVNVAGEHVPALHYRSTRELTGDQTGSERNDTWYAADNGLPLRNRRDIRVVSPAPAPLNEVTYTEKGEWELTSLVPET
jgi:hypothetical protein